MKHTERTASGGHRLPDEEYAQWWIRRVRNNAVLTATGCWEWQGTQQRFKNQKPGQPGYAATSYRGKTIRAHRKMLELKLGHRLPTYLHACHHCDNPVCVNPDHLYPATNQQNHLDGGKRKRMQGQLKTHCKNGHEFTPENTYWAKRGLSKCRSCRECQRESQRRGWRENNAYRRARQNAWRARRRQQQLNGTRCP